MRLLHSLTILLLLVTSAFAQYSPNEILLTIGNHKVSATEFAQTYIKNNQTSATASESVEDYFNLYIKYKLKVAAALDAKLDTLSSFKNEFKGYRNQLAKNYLTDNEALEKLINEAYFRTTNEVSASHFMVTLHENALPTDTLAAYEKIMTIRNRMLNNETFEKLAQELSEDRSAKTNNGYLGYFKAFKLPYSFESAAFLTPVGQISNPVRTRFGYHLVKVHNKRTSNGEVKVAHIMVASPANATDTQKTEAEKQINDIYTQLNSGKLFDTLAIAMSHDQYSARNGGELPWFGAGDMVPEFEDAAFALTRNGEISKPIKTNYGWHIIKLLERKAIPAFEAIQTDLKTKILQSDRLTIVEKSFVAKLRKQNTWEVNKKNLARFYVNDTLAKTQNAPLNDLLIIESKKYTAADFNNFLTHHTQPSSEEQRKAFVDSKFEEFVDQSMIAFENQNLEAKNPEFRQTVSEYYDGLLLFEIMNREVWSRASKDSAGLESYFAARQEKYNTPSPQKLQDIKGMVMSDYQQFLEDKWIEALKKKYKVTINTKLLNKIAIKYKTAKS